MSLSRLGNRSRLSDFTWPGFVDGLASLLMVFVFVLMVFVLQFFNFTFLEQTINIAPFLIA